MEALLTTEPAAPAAWKRYPYTPEWGDPRWFTFPYVDGGRRDLGAATYFVEGFLTGCRTGRQYAFMTIFADFRVVRRLLHASLYTFALFDCGARRYGTYSDNDFPRPGTVRLHHKMRTFPHHLALRYAAPAGATRWEQQRTEYGDLRPFAWVLELHGIDHHGARMRLDLDVEAMRPPAPLGGPELGGEMMFLGAERTFSYFQSGLQMHGRLVWGEVEEEVEGTLGWIDRQWAVQDFSTYQDWRNTRYRNEWRVMHFDNGWDLSCFHQYHRHQRNAVVPWTGISAQGPGPRFELRATHRVELEIAEFIASPGLVQAQYMLTEGPRYFPYRYRLKVPDWEMDVEAEPFVDAPAHGLPIEYWTGPVKISGRLFGARVQGYGFDERSRPWVRDFEVAAALRLTAEHLPGVDDAQRRLLAYRVWEVEALALRGDRRAAVTHLQARAVPLIEALPHTARSRVAWLLRDLNVVLQRKFPPPR